jgi:hypothetical protein
MIACTLFIPQFLFEYPLLIDVHPSPFLASAIAAEQLSADKLDPARGGR